MPTFFVLYPIPLKLINYNERKKWLFAKLEHHVITVRRHFLEIGSLALSSWMIYSPFWQLLDRATGSFDHCLIVWLLISCLVYNMSLVDCQTDHLSICSIVWVSICLTIELFNWLINKWTMHWRLHLLLTDCNNDFLINCQTDHQFDNLTAGQCIGCSTAVEHTPLDQEVTSLNLYGLYFLYIFFVLFLITDLSCTVQVPQNWFLWSLNYAACSKTSLICEEWGNVAETPSFREKNSLQTNGAAYRIDAAFAAKLS